MKIAIIYCKKSQTSLQDIFNNSKLKCLFFSSCDLQFEMLENPSAEFLSFLELMGEKINLQGWTKYRGDMGQEETTYYTEFEGFQGEARAQVIQFV